MIVLFIYIKKIIVIVNVNVFKLAYYELPIQLELNL